jgi:hypothetical protein
VTSSLLPLALVVSSLAAVACQSPAPSSGVSGADAGSGAAGTVSAGTGGGAGGGAGGAACVDQIDLRVHASTGVPDRIHVPVTFQGKPALFLLDTGSALTFLTLGAKDPDYVPNAGTVTVGCSTLSLPGRGGLAPSPDEYGLPVVGTLGVDFLVGGATLLDTAAQSLVRHHDVTVPPGVSGWDELHWDDVKGHVVVPTTLDGVAARLILDTGSPHNLWLGQQGKPGDLEVMTSDAKGNPLTFYFGDVTMVLTASEAVIVPVLRAPSFPYFEATVKLLGGNIHGLLGLSALQNRALFFEGATGRIRLGPVP